MLIVPIGNVLLQGPDVDMPDMAFQVMENIAWALPGIIGQMLNKHLEMEITRFLGRGHYQRRRHAKRKETQVKCSRCQSRERQKFRRNGYYRRGLVTKYGHTQLGMPQLKCECGGNVRFDFQTIRVRQRFGVDVQVFVQKEYQAGQSYRQIQVKLEECLHSSVGLRTLNKQVLAVGEGAKTCQTWEKGDAPPVVRFDGIWLTVMFETGEVRRDQLGRVRPVKRARKIPILAAQGVTVPGAIPAPTSAQVPWMFLDPNTLTVQPMIGATLDEVPPIEESYTESFELGWTGIMANRLSVSADVYYMKKNDFVSPLIVQTPLLTLSGPALVAYLTPYVGAANAAALAAGIAQVPLGVVAAPGVGPNVANLVATYRNLGDVTLWGGDVAFQWFLTDVWNLSGTVSAVSDDYFRPENAAPIALNAPEVKGSVGVAYRDTRAGFNGGAQVRFNTQFPAESAGYVGTLCIPDQPVGLFTEECVSGHGIGWGDEPPIFDVNFAYKVPTTAVTLQLVVNNIFNSANRSFVGVPSIGRFAMLSARYNLF